MDDLQCIVEAMLPSIESKFNAAPSTFKLWFGDFVLLSLDEKEAVFCTPTELRKKILTSKYTALISEALVEIIGFEVDIKIVSNEELAASKIEPEPLNLTPTKEEAKENADREKKPNSLR